MTWVHVFGNRDGTLLRAHKLVLASQTSYFEGLFRQENPGQVIGHIFSCRDCRTAQYVTKSLTHSLTESVLTQKDPGHL